MRHLSPAISKALALLALAGGLLAPASTAQGPANGSRAIKCGQLLTGDGVTALEDVWLIVENGKVKSIGKTAPPAGVPVTDASNKVVMPGIVAVDTDLSAAADSQYQVTPDALAVDAFDFEKKLRAELEGGVTTIYLSPGRQRLVSGQGAVVKTTGDDIIERVLDDTNCVRMNFGDTATKAPRVFEPNPHPTSDEPLEPSRIQTPTARISVLPELRALLAAAADADKGPGGEGPAEHQFDERALAAVATGQMTVRAAAVRTHDVHRALSLQKELGLKMVLEDPQHIGPVATLAAEQNVPATFRVPIRFGMKNPGGENRRQKTLEPRPDAPARAAKAGMKIGLSPAAGVSARDFLMAVAIAVRHGLPRAHALRAIGADAAAILGVEDRVGTLATGRDADFVILSGDPLAVGTMVESTWVAGERAWQRKAMPKRNVLAVRCGRILDATGRVFRDGMILVQDGRIKAVGEELAVPYGAEVIDLGDAVMTPGFVDAFSHLGLAGDGQGVPSGSAAARLHEAIEPDDPMFAAALAEGLTTVLVSGKDRGTSPHRVAAIKLGAVDHTGMALRPIAGVRMAHDAITPNAINAVKSQLDRGKAYAKKWADYEKALIEWKTGKAAPKKEAAKKPEGDATKKAAADVDPITGTWEAELDIRGQIKINVILALERQGKKVTGTVQMGFGSRRMRPRDISSGSYENGTLKLEFRGMGRGGDATLEATVKGDTMTGKVSIGPAGNQDFTAKRTSKDAPKKSAAPKRVTAKKTEDEGKPKAPKLDANLEPLRAVVEKRAALVVTCNRAAAIRDVIALLEKEKVPYVLQGVADLLDDASIAGEKRPTVIVDPVVVSTDDDGELRNKPAILADRGQPVLFGSGECAGARFLPMHATYAVRYGLSPADALAALTIWPARAFQLDDRIGTLEKGKDADFVVFSGNPFEPQSRVLLTVCNGRIVVDNRSKQ
ncbi:MAG: amidohydrolase family protein [bacterium]|nr:amidohydrolase family protein [bacterium]